jgi:drug/metabolite transporter (DMT)-like permease
MSQRALPWQKWLPEFVLLAVLWGSSFLFMREGTREFGPAATAWVRVTSAALMLTPLLLWRGEFAAFQHSWKRTFVAGIFNAGVPFIFYAYALSHISTGLSSILNATTPLFGALIAWLWLGDKLNPSRLIGLAIGFGGVVLLAWHAPSGVTLNEDGSSLAILACLGATFCYGIAGSLIKRYLSTVPALVTTTGSLWGCTLLLAPFAYWTWPQQMPSLHAWGAMLISGSLCTAVAYVLYFRLIASTGPAHAMTVTYLIPVFANLIGIVWLDEIFTPWMMAGGAVILLGTALASGLVGRRVSGSGA